MLEVEGVKLSGGEVMKRVKEFTNRVVAMLMSGILIAGAVPGTVLASDIPGCMEAFDEGVSGIGFTPHNTEDMIRAMMTQMGRTPSEKQVRAVMRSMNDAAPEDKKIKPNKKK